MGTNNINNNNNNNHHHNHNTLDEYAHNEEIIASDHKSNSPVSTTTTTINNNNNNKLTQDNKTLFTNFDKSWLNINDDNNNVEEIEATKKCFISYCMIFSPIPHALTKLSGVTVPLKVVYILWYYVLNQKQNQK